MISQHQKSNPYDNTLISLLIPNLQIYDRSILLILHSQLYIQCYILGVQERIQKLNIYAHYLEQALCQLLYRKIHYLFSLALILLFDHNCPCSKSSIRYFAFLACL